MRNVPFAAAFIASVIIGAGLGLASPLQITYELQHVDANGSLYILDHYMRRDDCRAALETLPKGYAACAAVPS